MSSLTGQQAFEGFERDDGSVGVRNAVLVLPSVICSRIVAERIADQVPAARAAPHDHGCGQIGADKDQTARTFQGVAANPNVAGTVVVGLGCESIQSDAVAADIAALDRPVHELSIQGAGGTDACIDRGVEAATDLAEGAATADRRPAGLGDLTLGIVSSDAASSTVGTADPLVGAAASRILDAGGRVVVAGIERLLPHREAVHEAATGTATDGLTELLDRHADRPARSTRVRRDAADYDFAELAAAWDGRPIESAIGYGERADRDAAVTVVDAPAQFEEAATGLAAAGASIIVHVTGEGIPSGHPIVPTVKVSGDGATLEALGPDIDVDATADAADDLVAALVGVADGAPTRAEEHGLSSFAITRVGPSM